MLDTESAATKLRISVPPSFGSNWLTARLPNFHTMHPGIDLVIDAMFEPINVARGEADVVIRFGPGRYTGLRSERILDEYILPLCSPRIEGHQ